ncbi:MAG: MotA/TolQ/ExbB proton channel family protein [Gallionella sp.]|nr:MotA/TolQ/ExbB proton channel family protein [Gallionella sp.]
MFNLIEAAGWPIWLLIISSLIAVTLIVERIIYLRRKNILPPKLLAEVVHELKQRGVTPQMLERLCANSPLGRVFAAGLKNIKSTPQVMKEAIEEEGRCVSHDMDRFLTTLGTIASISPLLGLFGTLIGMIEIFGAQNAGGSNPAELAHGISVALYNTAFGLIVAIPSMIAYRHFRALVDSFTIELEQQAVKLVEIMHGERK